MRDALFSQIQAPMKATALTALFILAALISLYGVAAGWTAAELSDALVERAATTGSGPVVYDGLEWFDRDALERYLRVKTALVWFPWMDGAPQPIALMLTALACGSTGGIARVTYDRLRVRQTLRTSDFAALGLSALTGLIILGLTYIIPAALTISDATVRPVALLFFCILGGVFYDVVFERCRAWIASLLPREKS